jgi:glycosyltransferase involved in cell wall biosynthesis
MAGSPPKEVYYMNNKSTRKKLLIVSLSYCESLKNVNMNKYLLLKDGYYGDFLGVVDNRELLEENVDGFKMKVTYIPSKWLKKKYIKYVFFFVTSLYKTLYSHYRHSKYDVIIAREPQLAGPMALLISKLTGTKLIVELNGNYASSYVWEDSDTESIRRVKRLLSSKIIPFVLKRADGIKLLYEKQISPYGNNEAFLDKVVSTFHDYTPVSLFKPSFKEEKVILSIGYPYRIKGFDIAIKGFLKVADKLPDYELHLVGYLLSNEEALLNDMIGDNKQIKLIKPLNYPDAIKKISTCSIFLLASRTEAMGRVLLEAMAHKKPLIGSNTDGIPSYVEDHFNGLTFESENENDLAQKILCLTNNAKLRKELAENGLNYVNTKLSEEMYLRHYQEMIQAVLK